jgi:FkbM family methyltransferase
MNRICKYFSTFAILFLTVALCVVSAAFYKNHRRAKAEIGGLRLEVGPDTWSNDDAALLQKVLDKDLRNGFSLRKVTLDGLPFIFCDLAASRAVSIVAREINRDNYTLSSIDFREGDVVIDVGGNTGMVSIFLAKKFPFLKIYAFEPVRENFKNFKRNIKLNGIPEGAITVKNLAVTKDGRDVSLNVEIANSGGSSLTEYLLDSKCVLMEPDRAKSVTLDDIFKQYDIKACKLLKLDCEGSEYEILYGTSRDTLKKCKHLRAEFHETPRIRKAGYSIDKLIEYCKGIIEDVSVCPCVQP